jgi:hypothetical protein
MNGSLCLPVIRFLLQRLALPASADSISIDAISHRLVALTLRASLRDRAALQLEILALRHQLQVVNRSRRQRLRLTQADRLL